MPEIAALDFTELERAIEEVGAAIARLGQDRATLLEACDAARRCGHSIGHARCADALCRAIAKVDGASR